MLKNFFNALNKFLAKDGQSILEYLLTYGSVLILVSVAVYPLASNFKNPLGGGGGDKKTPSAVVPDCNTLPISCSCSATTCSELLTCPDDNCPSRNCVALLDPNCSENLCGGAAPNGCGAANECGPPTVCADDGNPCTQNAGCNPSTGSCEYPAIADHASCTDPTNLCQPKECISATCSDLAPILCTAQVSNDCIASGACNPATGACDYTFEPNGAACDDGDPCTEHDSCDGNGSCAGTPSSVDASWDDWSTCECSIDCTDGDDEGTCEQTRNCIEGSCGGKTCAELENEEDSSQISPCTGDGCPDGQNCSNGSCCDPVDAQWSPWSLCGDCSIDCTDGDDAGTCEQTRYCITDGACGGKTCAELENEESSSQFSPCTGEGCPDGQNCSNGFCCDPVDALLSPWSGCLCPVDCGGSSCEETRTCTPPVCGGKTCEEVDPDEGGITSKISLCTGIGCENTDICDSNGRCCTPDCTHAPDHCVGEFFDDGCGTQTCEGSTPPENDCNCAADGDAQCDDGNLCNGVETCSTDGTCAAGTSIVCDSQVCNPDNGQCVDCLTDENCDDLDACTGTETCVNKTCVSGTNIVCDPQVCNPDDGTCVECVDDTTCSGQFCDMSNNTCVDCLTDENCDDHDACTGTETCSNAICVRGTDIICNDNVSCSNDSCDPSTGECTFSSNCSSGLICDLDTDTCVECVDDDDCTDPDTCGGGGTPNACGNCNWTNKAISLTVVVHAECSVNVGKPTCTSEYNGQYFGKTPGTPNNCLQSDATDPSLLFWESSFLCLCNSGNCANVQCTTPPGDSSATGCFNPTGYCSDGGCVYTPKPDGSFCGEVGKFCYEGYCVECADNSNCIGNANGEVCNPDDGTCVECVDDTTCSGQFCDMSNNTCVDCLTDENCDDHDACTGTETCVNNVCVSGTEIVCDPQVCNPDDGVCVECVDDSTCTSPDTCSGGGTLNECGCTTTCTSEPGCRASLGNGTVISGTCCTAGQSCYNCSQYYHWNSGSGTCEANTCQGTTPSSATHTAAWDADESSNIINNTTNWTYIASDNSTKCQFKCDPSTNYTWDGTACVINGECGAADGGSFYNVPTSSDGLCDSGSASNITYDYIYGTWNWTCSGGINDSCSAHKKIDGVCGPYDGQAFSEMTPQMKNDDEQLCSVGSVSSFHQEGYYQNEGPWTWECSGMGGGSNAECIVHLKALCGPYNGGTFATELKPQDSPFTNYNDLCSSGEETAVTQSGDNWLWECLGSQYGIDDSCSANLPTTPYVAYDPPLPSSGYTRCMKAGYGECTAAYTRDGIELNDVSYSTDVYLVAECTGDGICWESISTGTTACKNDGYNECTHQINPSNSFWLGDCDDALSNGCAACQ